MVTRVSKANFHYYTDEINTIKTSYKTNKYNYPKKRDKYN